MTAARYDDVTAARGRLVAESRMKSRCTIRRKTGATTTVNRMEVPVWDAVHTDLPCRLDGSGAAWAAANTKTVAIGQTSYELTTGIAHVPHSTTDLEDDDLLEVTEGECAGVVFRIIQAPPQFDQKTARRLPIEEAPRPTEWP